MGSRRNELNMHLNERLVKIYENCTFDFTCRWFNFILLFYQIACADCIL